LNRGNRRRVLRAEGEGKLQQFAVADSAADGWCFRVDQRRAASHRHLLGQGADRELRVDTDRLPRVDSERIGAELLEARQLDVDLVESLRQVLKLERAGALRHRRACERRLHFGQRDRRAREDATARVRRDADDGTVGRLGRC
jgi:hypothetical protein